MKLPRVDVDVRWKNFGFFGRGYGLYDFNLHDSDKLGPTGRDRLGQNITGLDGYVYGSFDPWDKNLRIRAGRQVISWGESTFIQGGINVINPVDVSKLRVPGAGVEPGMSAHPDGRPVGQLRAHEGPRSRASTSPTGTRCASIRAVPSSRPTMCSPTTATR